MFKTYAAGLAQNAVIGALIISLALNAALIISNIRMARAMPASVPEIVAAPAAVTAQPSRAFENGVGDCMKVWSRRAHAYTVSCGFAN